MVYERGMVRLWCRRGVWWCWSVGEGSGGVVVYERGMVVLWCMRGVWVCCVGLVGARGVVVEVLVYGGALCM